MTARTVRAKAIPPTIDSHGKPPIDSYGKLGCVAAMVLMELIVELLLLDVL